jgi:hypothetical protein
MAEEISKLRAEKETWGNEFSAVCVLKEKLAEVTKDRDEWHDGYSAQLAEKIRDHKCMREMTDDLQALRKQVGDSRAYAQGLHDKLLAFEAREVVLRCAVEKLLPAATWFLEGPYGNSPEQSDLDFARNVLRSASSPPLLGVLKEVERVLDAIVTNDFAYKGTHEQLAEPVLASLKRFL